MPLLTQILSFPDREHPRANRRRAGFVVVDCAAFPDTLLESELFGHVRGSLANADR